MIGVSLAKYVEGLEEGTRGEAVQRKAHRTVWRVDEGEGPGWHAKRGAGPKRAEIRREARNARIAWESGFGARVLADGEWRGAEWLVTETVDGDPWPMLYDTGLNSRPCEIDLAALLRRLHDAGFSFPDLAPHHVLRCVDPARIVLIDLARMEVSPRPVPADVRARDLAAFLFGGGPNWLGWSYRACRIRLVRDATGASGRDLRRMCDLVERGMFRLASRTRWRRDATFVSPFLCDVIEEATGREIAEPRRDTVLAPGRTELVRKLPDRENRRIDDASDGTPAAWVKVFPPVARGWSPAMREVAAIDLFQRSGILVNHLAAFSEDTQAGSFVAVAHCEDGMPLDDVLRFGASPRERRALARGTAAIWRRMRDRGLRHRDAYACHVFARRTGPPEEFELRLIDLTRAGRAPWPKERWFVKDAAQLWHGSRLAGATATDAARWLRAYFREDRLSAAAKRFARKVAAKERSIEARAARRRKRAR
ncbi:MAG: hypothetical protein HMLKMBBP_02252 [Planctomycetes bacterium]|nr:hypothetical protein [Planctomycetota bacterium]